MKTLTIRLPDDMGPRIKNAAATRGISVNRWIADLSLQALASQDAETHFHAMAKTADVPGTLALFDRLDRRTEASRRTTQTKKRCLAK